MIKVLLVDDDAQLRTLISQLLILEGFEVTCCKNGEECLEQIKTEPLPQIIVLDVMMPKKNGWDTLRELRQKKMNLPVLMLSAKGDSVDRVTGLELGADDYLAKPFDDRELVARIRALTRRILQLDPPSANHNGHVIQMDSITLNSHQMQVFFRETSLDLTSTEFSLLLYLVKNKGRAISRDELSQSVLGKRHQTFDRVIDMHLSNLRKKLPARDNHLPWFKTIHGKGYMLVEEE